MDENTRYGIGTLIFILLGPIVWGAHFTVLYGLQSSMCALDIGGSGGGHNGLVTLLVLVATGLLVAFAALATWKSTTVHGWLSGGDMTAESAPFLTIVMRALAALSGLAMTYAAIAAVLLPACAQMR